MANVFTRRYVREEGPGERYNVTEYRPQQFDPRQYPWPMPNEVVLGDPTDPEHQLVFRLPHGFPAGRAHYSNERISLAEMTATDDPRTGQPRDFATSNGTQPQTASSRNTT